MSSKLSNISRIASAAPEVDVEKVRAVKTAVYRGSYRVDPKRIASKLIQLDTALHRARRRRDS